ncbi:MAG: hypothetical protein JWL95_889 [Gemmatimonadetes bacterium]|nr:hypothetical protein [Gemmatimonadota bacterium]
MLSLTSLAGWEDAVLASVAGSKGTIEERDSQVERSGLYGEYPAIVNAYIALFSDPDSALEALKRAYFLVWRSAMVLPADSGIPPLPEGTVRIVIDELDARARREPVDEELSWMLAWYHALAPFLLELYGASPRLVQLASSGGAESWREARFTPAAMKGRGQLGRYWSALATSAP